jgi:hypothetical protein
MRKIPPGYGRGCIGDRTGAMGTKEGRTEEISGVYRRRKI